MIMILVVEGEGHIFNFVVFGRLRMMDGLEGAL